MKSIVRFCDDESIEPAVSGGKGANLARMLQAGLPVPDGFIVTTESYDRFVSANAIGERVTDILSKIDYTDAEGIDSATAAIRSLVEQGELPTDVTQAVREAYAALGDTSFVAVRSSGTAEDLADASFAGQHDTYLDICGTDELFDAIRRCWASLWTSRATAYRQRGGFDQGSISIAVVVQTMVASEVSGVMFTANPLTSAVDEIVINASWGLGEGIVSGILTPDLFILDRRDHHVKARTIGSKEVEVVRDAVRGLGICTLPVDDRRKILPCLSDAQLATLAALGERVGNYYDGLPQDIEWGYLSGSFYVLQSRDVTGVDFSWDDDLDRWNSLPKSTGTTWTRAWSDAIWTGRITPLFYAIRAEVAQRIHNNMEMLWGFPDVAELRFFKYHRANVYYNSKIDYLNYQYSIPPAVRKPDMFANMPKAWREELMAAPFSWTKFAKIFERIETLDPKHGPYRAFDNLYERMEHELERANGLDHETLQGLSDDALLAHAVDTIDYEVDWINDMWTPMFLLIPMASSTFSWMLESWFGSADPLLMADLISGLPKPVATTRENLRMWELARMIASSPVLTTLFEENEGEAFFKAVETHPAASKFREKYHSFVADFGHRGHEDRDVFFTRRVEDPGGDYPALRALITVDQGSPEETARNLIERRETLTREVAAKIRRGPWGEFKAEAFLMLQRWMLDFFMMRDDQREFSDRVNFAQKRAFMEIGRRLAVKGVFGEPADHFFFAPDELYEIMEGKAATRLIAAKLDARKRNFCEFRKDGLPPMYMVDDSAADLDREDGGDDGARLRGMSTSRGVATGVARVISSHKEMGRVQTGDILITTSTDPGWTPVFMVISGLVLETGGLLAHGSCISREYGIPAIQISGAMGRIPDGATITVNGNTGEVIIHE